MDGEERKKEVCLPVPTPMMVTRNGVKRPLA